MAKSNFIDAQKIIDELTESFKKHQKIIDENATALVKLEKEYSKLPSDYIKAQKELIGLNVQRKKEEAALNSVLIKKQQLEQSIINTQIKENSLIKSTIDLKNKESRERDKNEKAAAREAAKLLIISNVYDKTQRQLNVINKEYDNLSAKKARYNNLTDFEEKRLQTLTKTTQKYDTILKGLDATKGKYTRSVGNYANAFNPLNNSIGQIARELPNFGQSIQIGIMSITNNIGALQDAVGGIVAQNKILAAEGKATQSVMKQAAGSILSFNVLLYVGIAFLNAYGKEIGDWASALWAGSKALNALKESQAELNVIRVSSLKSIVDERIQLANNLKTAKDEALSKEERLIAVKKLQSEYPFYFKNLTTEQILLGKTAQAEKEVNAALLARAKSQAAVTKITENQAKVIDLEEKKIDLRKQLTDAELQNSKAVQKSIGDNSRGDAAALRSLQTLVDVESIKRKILKGDKEIAYWNEINNRLIGYSLSEREKSIGLDYQEEKGTKKKIKSIQDLSLELEDYLADLYALRKAEMELEAKTLDAIYKDQSHSFSQRITAYKSFVDKKIEIAELDYEEEKRLENKSFLESIADSKEKVNEFIKDGGNRSEAQKKLNNSLESLNKSHKLKLQLIDLKYSENSTEIVRNMYKRISELTEAEAKGLQLNLINQKELDDLRELSLLLKNLNIGSDISEFKEAEKLKTDYSIEATKKRLSMELISINEKIAKETLYTEEYIDLTNQRISKELELAKIDEQIDSEKAQRIKKLKIDTENYFKSIQSGFLDKSGLGSLNFFLALDENGKSTFERLIEGADTMGKKGAISFQGIGDVAQEVFAIMNQKSEARFEAEFARIDSQKEIAIKYAGESSVAREEIERQYEQRRIEIERRKAAQQKKAAIFNVIIDTAQAIAAAVAESPLTFGLPFSAIAAAIGAAQIGVISSQQIPGYKDGTDNHSGGAMIINDGNGSSFTETVVTPDGKATQYKGRNVLLDAPKGTKVLTHEQWNEKLNDILLERNIGLSSSSINPNITIENNSISATEMDRIFSKHFSNIQTNVTNFDKKGFENYSSKRGQKTINLNNRVSFKGFSI